MNEKSKAIIRFFQGIDETVIPEIRLTRSKDGRVGQAIFFFDKPKALENEKFKEIQGMFMIDEEGQLTTRQVNVSVSNGKLTSIEAIFSWKTDQEFNRFMRFANRYAEYNGLGYSEK